jgi:hypothetical protein
MPAIDWNKFGVTGASKRDSFEELCLHLFCRRHKLSEGVSGDFNQAGLETEPVKVGKKTYGFQSKHFDKRLDYSQIKDSIVTSLNKYGSKLDEICVFINLDAKPNNSKSGKKIAKIAKKSGVKIKWYTRRNFEVALTKPNNLDLAFFYFGYGSEFKFIEDSADHTKLTLIKSKQFLKLHFLDSKNKRVQNLEETILRLSEKLVLISGDPASGKSTLVHRLFYFYSGMSETSQTKMVNKIILTGAVPQVVNLKLCATDSLENIIRTRQSVYAIQGTELKIIYLLDGLDEISEDRADLILLQMLELSKKKNTHKIIVTCRSGNFNKIQLKNYFKNCIELKVGQLGIKDIDNYFKARGDASRQSAYDLLKLSNPKLVSSITDVLGLILLWDSIELLNNDSTVLDLYELKVKRVLCDPAHYKDLPGLNLPNPKNEAILSVNETISYKFHEKFQFLLPLHELQEIISEAYPKIDYNAINSIINYIASLFFDISPASHQEAYYVYKHRRYQEYFFITLLQKRYAINPSILRELSILSNLELFQTFFIKGLRKKYVEENNLIGCLDLSLLDVYLGNHSGWGVDSPYYLNSPDFIKTLVDQQDAVFNILFEDDNLNIRSKIFVDTHLLKDKFEEWKKDSDNLTHYRAEQVLIDGWQEGRSRLMNLVVDFWQAGRKDIANEIISNVREIQTLYKKNKFFELLGKEQRQHISHSSQNTYKSWIFYLMNILEDSAEKILNEKILPIMDDNDDDFGSKRGVGDDIKSYLSVLVSSQPSQLVDLIDKLPQPVLLELLRILTRLPSLKLFIEYTEIYDTVKKIVATYDFELNENNYHILFFKKYFSLDITEHEHKYLNKRKDKIVQERDIDWRTHGYEAEFALIAYIIGDYSLEQETTQARSEHGLDFYSERVAYAVLYVAYISMLKGDTSFEYIYRQYAKYCELKDDTRYTSKALLFPITVLWAYIYGHSTVDNSTKKLLAKRLVEELHINKYSFYLNLNTHFPSLFSNIVSESEIASFESDLDTWKDDFQSKVDRYLDLSRMYKEVNPQRASELFIKAIVDGTLRHGWRKDPIVHYDLVNALGVLLEKQWLKEDELGRVLDEVWDLVLRAYEISDGSGTSRGPYRFIETVAKFDRDIAIQYKDRYVKREGRYSVSNSLYTPILLSRLRAGLSIESIEEGFGEFHMDYDYESKPHAEYYEQKFVVYLEIAKSELYSDEEKIEVLNKANDQISTMQNQGLTYYLSDTYYENEVQEFLELCKKFNITSNIKLGQKSNLTPTRKYSSSNEQKFRSELKDAKTKQKIRGAYKRLRNYKNEISLKDSESWQVLIDKTYELFGNINLFIEYLESINYPHSDYYSSAGGGAHLGLACALGDSNYKQEMLDYLYVNGGHGGFSSLIKTYAQLNDREMSIDLFNRYVALCKLLTE